MMDAKPDIPQTIVEENYVKFQHELLEFLFAHLVDMRAIFEGDLDALLIFISISRYYLRDERINAASEEAGPQQHHHHLTLSRIAQITTIPRETVRRKLSLLESKGLLERGPNDGWRLVVKDGRPVIRARYESVWQRVMRRLVKLVRALKEHV
ncbi:hypothetical protein [Methylocystis echinoides]|jgi:hypothetical protein|uniref:hypothetical protein n=1 Tax=Methylocystis echinoides TaxID=29468 RepID=UPI00341DD8EE